MLLTLLKSKLHNARVTEANIDYEGSVAIDEDLLDEANMLLSEKVEIYNITNGERFATYTIPAPRGSKMIGIQGAAAHKANKGDRVIICTYCQLEEKEAKKHKPIVKILDENNNVKS